MEEKKTPYTEEWEKERTDLADLLYENIQNIAEGAGTYDFTRHQDRKNFVDWLTSLLLGNGYRKESCVAAEILRWGDKVLTEKTPELKQYLTSMKILYKVPREPVFLYGMRNRPFDIACQPMDGFVECRNDFTGKYYNVLAYNRQLSTAERLQYELDFLGEEETEKRFI